MLHPGMALELSRLSADDLRADAEARRRVRSAQTSYGSRVGVGMSSDPRFGSAVAMRDGARIDVSDDPWWAWRVVEPDAEYLRRRAA